MDVSQILTGGEVGGRQEAIRASDAALSLPNELFKELAELSEQSKCACAYHVCMVLRQTVNVFSRMPVFN